MLPQGVFRHPSRAFRGPRNASSGKASSRSVVPRRSVIIAPKVLLPLNVDVSPSGINHPCYEAEVYNP